MATLQRSSSGGKVFTVLRVVNYIESGVGLALEDCLRLRLLQITLELRETLFQKQNV